VKLIPLRNLGSKWIDYFKKWKSAEICIPCADLPYSMLAHENGRVGVAHHVAREVGKLQNDFFGNVRMAVCRGEQAYARRGEQRSYEFPCGRRPPRRSHHPWMSGDAQELIKDRPSRIPSVGAPPLTIEPFPAGDMKL
jgi:hypothetical protein